MFNNIENYIYNTEDEYTDNYTTENQKVKEALSNLLDKLPSLTHQEWTEIFNLISSNSLEKKTNIKEAYIVAFSKILLRYAA